MKNIRFILLFCLSSAFACHMSCNCPLQSNKCTSCKFPGSQIDIYGKSCPCPQYYYTSSFSPFQCAQLLQYSGENVNSTEAIMNSCYIDMGMKTKYINVETLCSLQVEMNVNYVKLVIRLNMNNISLNQSCQELYKSNVQYYNPQSMNYIDMPISYVKDDLKGSKTVLIPLIEIYYMAKNTVISADEISQVLSIQIQIGNQDYYLRNHQIDLIVYTNKNETNVFSTDFEQQKAMDCIDNNNCITITDVDLTAQICSDSTCLKPLDQASYRIGDNFYAQIKFVDSTKTKQLKLVSLLFKDDSNKIMDLTSITKSEWKKDKLIISFTMSITSNKGIIQVCTTTENLKLLRNLQSDQNNQQISQTKFQATIVDHKFDYDSLQLINCVIQDNNIQHLKFLYSFTILYYILMASFC